MGTGTDAEAPPCFPTPLVKPDAPISGIRLSVWLLRRLTNRPHVTDLGDAKPLAPALANGLLFGRIDTTGSRHSMTHRRSESRKRNPAAAAVYADAAPRPWVYVLSAVAAVLLVFWAYWPAIDGPFLFDDIGFSSRALSPAAWLHGVRPVLGFTYWINSRISQDTTYSYHVFNLMVHCFAGGAILLLSLIHI